MKTRWKVSPEESLYNCAYYKTSSDLHTSVASPVMQKIQSKFLWAKVTQTHHILCFNEGPSKPEYKHWENEKEKKEISLYSGTQAHPLPQTVNLKVWYFNPQGKEKKK